MVLQDALDDLCSPRTSMNCKGRALQAIHELMGDICIPDDPAADDRRDYFLALQDTFECNIPSRILDWISHSTVRLEQLTSKECQDHDRKDQLNALVPLLTRALGVIQGFPLMHKPSKAFLVRQYSLEILVDLLSVSRRLHPAPSTPDHKRSKSTSSPHPGHRTPPMELQIAILDTLICALVDSVPGLRIFEEIDGLKTVVKALKRSPYDVSMKCMAFICFYMGEDEFALSGDRPPASETPRPVPPVPTAPSTPVRSGHSKARSLAARLELRPSPYALSGHSSSSSESSALSDAESYTSVESSAGPKTPPDDAPLHHPLSALRRDADAIPQSPKKERFARLGLGSGPSSRGGLSPIGISGLSIEMTPSTPTKGEGRSSYADSDVSCLSPRSPAGMYDRRRRLRSPSPPTRQKGRGERRFRPRTKEEKEEILAGMVDNVDYLLENMRKVGIWGAC